MYANGTTMHTISCLLIRKLKEANHRIIRCKLIGMRSTRSTSKPIGYIYWNPKVVIMCCTDVQCVRFLGSVI